VLKGEEFRFRQMLLMRLLLVLVGEGEDRLKLEEKSVHLGLTQRIRFVGPLPPEQIPLWMAAADLFTLQGLGYMAWGLLTEGKQQLSLRWDTAVPLRRGLTLWKGTSSCGTWEGKVECD